MPARRSERACRAVVPAWLCLLLLIAPATIRAEDGIAHIVIIWLNEPGNAEHRTRVLEASRVLAAIPGVTGLQGGRVVASERAIVDDSFDVGLVIELENRAALDAYLAHPLHRQLVNETLKPLVKRIQVYDLRR
jgi:hypothetical protein